MTERQLQDAIVQTAQLFGWLVYHMHDSRKAAWGTSSAGFPDLVLARKGHLIFAELKTEKGRTTPSQRMWLKELDDVAEEVGVYLWRPADWSSGDIERILKP